MAGIRTEPDFILPLGCMLIALSVFEFLLRHRWATRSVEIVAALHWKRLARLSESQWSVLAALAAGIHALAGIACVLIAAIPGWLAAVSIWIQLANRESEVFFRSSAGHVAIAFVGAFAIAVFARMAYRVLTYHRARARAEAAVSYERGLAARRYVATMLPLSVLGLGVGLAFLLTGVSGV